jgi:hypothetical protein
MYTFDISSEWLYRIGHIFICASIIVGTFCTVVKVVTKKRRDKAHKTFEKAQRNFEEAQKSLQIRQAALGDWWDLYSELGGKGIYHVGALQVLRQFAKSHPPGTVKSLTPKGLKCFLDWFSDSYRTHETFDGRVTTTTEILGPYVRANVDHSKLLLPENPKPELPKDAEQEIRDLRIKVADGERKRMLAIAESVDLARAGDDLVEVECGKRDNTIKILESQLKASLGTWTTKSGGTWTTKSGETIPITELSLGHLRNAITYLERKIQVDNLPRQDFFDNTLDTLVSTYVRMKIELQRRNVGEIRGQSANPAGSTAGAEMLSDPRSKSAPCPCCPGCGREGQLGSPSSRQPLSPWDCINDDCERKTFSDDGVLPNKEPVDIW